MAFIFFLSSYQFCAFGLCVRLKSCVVGNNTLIALAGLHAHSSTRMETFEEAVWSKGVAVALSTTAGNHRHDSNGGAGSAPGTAQPLQLCDSGPRSRYNGSWQVTALRWCSPLPTWTRRPVPGHHLKTTIPPPRVQETFRANRIFLVPAVGPVNTEPTVFLDKPLRRQTCTTW